MFVTTVTLRKPEVLWKKMQFLFNCIFFLPSFSNVVDDFGPGSSPYGESINSNPFGSGGNLRKYCRDMSMNTTGGCSFKSNFTEGKHYLERSSKIVSRGDTSFNYDCTTATKTKTKNKKNKNKISFRDQSAEGGDLPMNIVFTKKDFESLKENPDDEGEILLHFSHC